MVMSDQKITEFRERALLAVTTPDPDQLLQRGRALRRRRRLAPVVALAAMAAVPFGLVNARGDAQSAPAPATQSPGSFPPLLGTTLIAEPRTYGLDTLGNPRAELLVDLVGVSWQAWSNGAFMTSLQGTVDWGVDDYAGTIIDRCRPDRHAKTRAGAITQLSRSAGPGNHARQAATTAR